MHEQLENDPYEILRKRLDFFPTSFPQTDEGKEIRILKKLFTPEEAEIACVLPLVIADTPQDARTIAERMGKDVGDMGRILESMTKKGLAWVKDNDGPAKVYSLPSFLHGLWEFTLRPGDSEMAQLLKGFSGSVLAEMGKAKARFIRVTPINKTISHQTIIHPYDEVMKVIETADSLCVMHCMCRTQARLTGEGCGHPEETCLFLNEYAEYLNSVGLGRKLTKDEAIELMTKFEAAGLIHVGEDTKRRLAICSCCPCSCLALKAITSVAKSRIMDVNRLVHSYFRLDIDRDLCAGCGTCAERCYTGALNLNDVAVSVEPEMCIGCGLCVSVCTSGALSLIRKSEEAEEKAPFDLRELYESMGWRSGKNPS